MPSWLVQFLISLAIRALEYYSSRLNSGHCDKIACVLSKAIPPESNPAPWKANNPNLSNSPDRGGKP